MNALCPQTTRRTRSIIASAATVMRHGQADHEIALINGQQMTRRGFISNIDSCLAVDGKCSPELQGWCDIILTTAGYASTHIERRIAAAREAQKPARLADLRDPEPVGFPIFSFLIFAQLLILATGACALAVWLFMWGAEHIGNRTAATLEQARNPAFVEWSE